jgi:SlyX protein
MHNNIRTPELERAQSRIDELETRVTYLEDTIDTLNSEIARLTQDFLIAHQAMQLMNRNIEQLAHQPGDKSQGIEPPPPHY